MMSQAPADRISTVENPPQTIGGIVRRLGPGLIVAGSIVGSGELIATTKTGAEAGFVLLWLILIGCVIKVFTQIEFGRYSLVQGQTTMDGLNEVPGPRIGRGNWIVWYWFLMWLASIAQLGGIAGGVGQALAISVPLTEQGRLYNEFSDHHTELRVKRSELQRIQHRVERGEQALAPLAAELQTDLVAADQQLRSWTEQPRPGYDDKLWAGLVAIVTAIVLVFGRYGLIQSFSTVMVAIFTLVTVGTVVLLQSNAAYAIEWRELFSGLSFQLPKAQPELGISPLATALATFGIIGVGASELVVYPYWCIEKGYARFTGRRDDSPEWAGRARGWLRVMQWDAWCSMVVYTLATLAFYLLGAAILHRASLNPEKSEMIRTLAVMYEPVFGSQAQSLFLFGAFAVLYSTFFVANASHARVFSDAIRVLGFVSPAPQAHRERVRILSGFFPLLCLVLYLLFPNPARLVLLSGLMQAIMLPMLAFAALYFRYRRGDRRLAPGTFWDIFLWISSAGMLIAGVWALVSELQKLLS